MLTAPCLFAEVNWGQGFVYGLIGGGILLAIFGLVQIFRAMQVEYKEREQVESNQPILIGYIVLGLVMIGGGIIMKDQVGGFGGGGATRLADFIEYTSKEGRFRAKFPKQPKEQSQGYLQIKFKMHTVEEKDGVYAVSYFDIPDLKPTAKMQASMLDNARNGMMYMMNAKLKGKPARIALEGRYPGQEFQAECKDKNVEMFCSIYLVDNRAYQVMIMGKHDWLESDKARKFLNSFALR